MPINISSNKINQFGSLLPTPYVERVEITDNGTNGSFIKVIASVYFDKPQATSFSDIESYIQSVVEQVNFYMVLTPRAAFSTYNATEAVSASDKYVERFIVDEELNFPEALVRNKANSYDLLKYCMLLRQGGVNTIQVDNISLSTPYPSSYFASLGAYPTILRNLSLDLNYETILDDLGNEVLKIYMEQELFIPQSDTSTVSYVDAVVKSLAAVDVLLFSTSLEDFQPTSSDLSDIGIFDEPESGMDSLYASQISDITYQQVGANGVFKDSATIVYKTPAGVLYTGPSPIQSIDFLYYGSVGATNKEIVDSFDLIMQNVSAEDDSALQDAYDNLRYILRVHGQSSNLLVKLNEYRKIFPVRSTAVPAGVFYENFERLLYNTNNLVKRGILLGKFLNVSPTVKDLREIPPYQLDPSTDINAPLRTSQGDSKQFIYLDSSLYCSYSDPASVIARSDDESFDSIKEQLLELGSEFSGVNSFTSLLKRIKALQETAESHRQDVQDSLEDFFFTYSEINEGAPLSEGGPLTSFSDIGGTLEPFRDKRFIGALIERINPELPSPPDSSALRLIDILKQCWTDVKVVDGELPTIDDQGSSTSEYKLNSDENYVFTLNPYDFFATGSPLIGDAALGTPQIKLDLSKATTLGQKYNTFAIFTNNLLKAIELAEKQEIQPSTIESTNHYLFGYWWFDYEKSLRTNSRISYAYNVSKLENLFGKEVLQNHFKISETTIKRNFIRDQLFIEGREDQLTNHKELSPDDFTTVGKIRSSYDIDSQKTVNCVVEPNNVIFETEIAGTTPNNMQASVSQPTNVTIPWYNEDTLGVDVAQNSATEYSYNIIRSFNTPGDKAFFGSAYSSVQNNLLGDYRLACFEHQEVAGPFDVDTKSDYDRSFLEYEVNVLDNTGALYFTLINNYKSLLDGEFEDYFNTATDECSYNNFSEKFNTFFVNGALQTYAGNIGLSPWCLMPTYYHLHLDLLYNAYYGDKELMLEAIRIDIERCAPESGNLESLSAFRNKAIALYNLNYSADGSISLRYADLLDIPSSDVMTRVSRSSTLSYTSKGSNSDSKPILYNLPSILNLVDAGSNFGSATSSNQSNDTSAMRLPIDRFLRFITTGETTDDEGMERERNINTIMLEGIDGFTTMSEDVEGIMQLVNKADAVAAAFVDSIVDTVNIDANSDNELQQSLKFGSLNEFNSTSLAKMQKTGGLDRFIENYTSNFLNSFAGGAIIPNVVGIQNTTVAAHGSDFSYVPYEDILIQFFIAIIDYTNKQFAVISSEAGIDVNLSFIEILSLQYSEQTFGEHLKEIIASKITSYDPDRLQNIQDISEAKRSKARGY